MPMGEDGEVRCRVDDVLAQAVALLHEHVEILARRMHGHPPWMVALVGTVNGTDELQLGRVGPALAVHPDLVRAQVSRVEERLGRIEDHAVYAGAGLVLVVLHIVRQRAGGVDGEDAPVASVVVKGVGVDGVGRPLGGQQEDGAGVCVRGRCLC